jgi:hypothetical protein
MGLVYMDVCFVITVAMEMLLRDCGPYRIIFMNVCIVVTLSMVMLLRDFGPYGISIYGCVFCYNRCHGNIVKEF